MTIEITSWPHYKIINIPEQEAWEGLRGIFPNAKANEMNFCLFSTSGVHGSYATLEDAAWDLEQGKKGILITFLVVHPRLVCLKYGNIRIESKEQILFLMELRKNSWEVIVEIGKNVT